jgi:Flp pilus assembly protein TadD
MIKPLRIRYSLLIIFMSLTVFAAGITYMKSPHYLSPKYYRSLLNESQESKLMKNQYFYYGRIAFDNGNYEEAREDFEKEIAINDKNYLAYYMLGQIYEDYYIRGQGQKYLTEMAYNYKKYIQLKPNGEHVKHAKLKLAQFYVKEGLLNRDMEKLETAEKLLKELDSSDGSVRMALGAIYFDKGNYDKAIEAFEKSANLPTGELKLKYNSLGLAYIKNKMYANAERVLQIAIVIDPKNPHAHSNLGFAYVQQGKLEEARVQFIEALKLDPSYNNAKLNLEWVDKQLTMKQRKPKMSKSLKEGPRQQ